MILVDEALKERARQGRPVKVVITGAGFMGRHFVNQIQRMDGMEVVGVVTRTTARAVWALEAAGHQQIEEVADLATASAAIAAGKTVVSSDPEAVVGAEGTDAVLEGTGDVDFGARVALTAIKRGVSVVLDNAELDATVGPILKVHADKAGVVVSTIDGDEPGVAMNLVRFVRTIGLRPVLAGNIKGFLNHHRNPDTQKAFAEVHAQDPAKVASFADGSKLAAECAVLANATGFGVEKRGMNGFELDDVKEILDRFEPQALLERPLVDFVLGASPGSGVFVVGYESDADRRSAMNYLKMGEGPLHLFSRPFHLPHIEAPISVARAVLFGDTVGSPVGAPVCDVLTVAKKDLEVGEALDGIGGFSCYGLIDNAGPVEAEGLLPLGLAEGAVMRRAVAKDSPLAYDDVDLPPGRLVNELRAEQDAHFRR